MKKYIDYLFPPRCPICDGILPANSMHQPHPHCYGKLKPISEPTCMSCGKPIDSYRTEYCMDCQKYKHLFDQGKAVFLYEGSMKLSMYRFKYANRREYAEFYAHEAALRYKDWFALIQPDLILPVPMYKKKKKQRGYNQAEIFAQALSQEIHVPCYPNLIERVRNTKPQKELSIKSRKNNLKNAFYVLQTVEKYRKILLIDDIYTTGTTMDAVANAIRQYQSKNIYFLCICIGRNI